MKWILVVCSLFPFSAFTQGLQIEHYGANPAALLSELWKIQVSGGNGSSDRLWVKAEVRSQSKLVYEAVTEPLVLSQSVEMLNQFKIRIKNQYFYEPAWENYVIATGKLPVGLYTGCVTVYNGQVEVKTLCLEIKSENYSPPMLIYPYDGQELTNSIPVLSWLAPVPNALRGITYDIKLVEQRAGQTAQEALLRNPARMQQSQLTFTSIPYPSDALPLEIEHSYAWQVQAYVGSTKIGVTEVWSFKVVTISNEIKERISKQSYIDINGQQNMNNIELIKLVKFKYNSAYSGQQLEFELRDEKGEFIRLPKKKFKLKSGDNYFEIDLSKTKGIRHEHGYSLVLQLPSGQRVVMHFTYLDPEKI